MITLQRHDVVGRFGMTGGFTIADVEPGCNSCAATSAPRDVGGLPLRQGVSSCCIYAKHACSVAA